MNRKIVHICFLIIISFFIIKNETFIVFANEQDIKTNGEKTITELNSNIQELERQRTNLDYKWDFLRKQYGGISGFIKEELSDEEFLGLEEINYIYNSKKKELDIRLIEKIKLLEETESIKQDLATLKKEFYKSLVIYIEPTKLSNFLEYIKGDIELNEKNKEIKEELYKEKVTLQEKVNTIKGQIEDHKRTLDKRIETLIRKSLDEKLVTLKSTEKYQNLSLENKQQFFLQLLKRVEQKRKELETLINKTSVIVKKIDIYYIIEQVIQGEIDNM